MQDKLKLPCEIKGGVSVLSLFDGMACGMLAFLKLGIKPSNYYAYEIDKYAIKTTKHNFPNIKQCGDVFEANFTQYEGIDYLIGGSPCTFWSIAQSPDKRETTASGLGWELFSQYVRALNEAKPKYFLYENNKSMSKAIYKSISDTFGFEPILINSALVSAQNRNRYYWCGKRNEDGTYSKVDIPQPEDRGILLKDILEGNDLTSCDKGWTLTASYGGAVAWNTIERHQRNMVAEPVNTTNDGESQTIKAQYQQTSIANICKYKSTYGASGVAEPVGITKDGKSFTVTAYYSTGQNAPHTLEKHIGSMVAEPVGTTKDGKSYCLTSGYANGSGENIGNYAAHTLEKGCKSMVAEQIRIPKYGIDNKARPLNACYQNNCGGFEHRIWNNNPNKQQVDLIAESVTPVNTTADGKAQCLRATCYKDTVRNIVGNDVDRKTGVAESVRVGALPRPNGELSTSQAMRVYSTEGKSVNLCAGSGGMGGKTGLYAVPANYPRYAEPCEWDNDGNPTKAISFADGKKYVVYSVADGQIEIKEKTYPIKLPNGYYIIRKLTVKECMRLQTVPEWYDFSAVSQTQAYKCLGNGWTVDVIAHILKGLLNTI